MPLNSVKLYSEKAYYDEVYGKEVEELESPKETSDPALNPDPITDSTSADNTDPLSGTYTPVRDQPIDPNSNFQRGLEQGVRQTQAMGGGLKALVGSATGQEEWVEDGMAYYQKKMAEAEQFQGDVMKIEDVDSVADFGAYASHTLGTLIPDLAGMVATGGLGSAVVKKGAKESIEKLADKYVEQGRKELLDRGMDQAQADQIAGAVKDQFVKAKTKQLSVKGGTAGAFLYGTGTMSGNQFAQTLEDTGVEAPFISLSSGTAQSALNALPAFKVLGDMIPKNQRDEVIEFIQDGVNEPWVGAFLKDVFQVGGLEGATEALQYIIEDNTISYVNNNFSENDQREYFDYISNSQKQSQLLNSFVQGTIGGTTIGTASSTAKALQGGYQNNRPDMDNLRDVTPEDADVRQYIADTYNKYRDPNSIRIVNSEGQTTDVITPELVANDVQQKNIDQATEQLKNQFGENYDPTKLSVVLGEGDDVNITYTEDATPAQEPVTEATEAVEPVVETPAVTSREVPQGTREYGHEHKWDGDLTDASTPIQDQLLEVSRVSQTPEALDPNNTDVVVEPIDQDDIDRVFDRNETLKIGTNDKPKGKSLPTVEEAYGTKAGDVTNTVGGVMADLSANGVPTKFVDAVSGVFVHTDTEVDAPALTGFKSRGISINDKLIIGSMSNPDDLSELAWTMTHEVYHAADYAYGLSDADDQLGIRVDEDAKEPSVVMGDIMTEIFDNWEKGTPVGNRFDYPFNDLQDDINDAELANDKVSDRYRQEVFAQLGALFHSNPKQLQEFAPKAYNYIKGIRDNNLQTAQAEVQDEQSSSPVTQETSQPSGISGQVRAPPEPRGEQVVQPESTGSDGEGSIVQERADTPVERAEQDESGEPERSDVQESVVDQEPRTEVILKPHSKKPRFKKAENYEDTGEYIVSFPDGDRYRVYYDDYAAEVGDPTELESLDRKIEYLGETKNDAIQAIVDHRAKLIEAGEKSYNTPLDPIVSKDTVTDAWSFIADKEGATEKTLRKKFKRLEDNQFENLKEQLLDKDVEAEDLVVMNGDKFIQQDILNEIEQEQEAKLVEQELGDIDDDTGLTDEDLSDLDDMGFIKKGAEYLLEDSKGDVSDKKQVPVKKLNAKNAEANIAKLDEIIKNNPDALASPDAWRAFERSLTGQNTHLAPPYALINLFNNMDGWVDRHSQLTTEQRLAAKNGLDTAKRMGELYANGVATPNTTAKLLLWGLLSRRLTASSQEAAYVDLVTGTEMTQDLIQKTLDGTIDANDKDKWIAEVKTAIPEGSFGKSATSNANDFFPLLMKMSEQVDGVSKLQNLHNTLADSSIPSFEVRRQFQAQVQGSGIDNKVFSFMMLMMGRDDVVILDRIQLNSMWDSGRYGKLIYDDIADEFSGFHGLARYEALENALQTKITDLYKGLGREQDASVGRYHWESWVLNSGQIVAHPTMQGLEKDAKGEDSPYAFLGAPEGKGDLYRFGAIYARDEDANPYILYSKSNGDVYKFSTKQFGDFLKEVKKSKNGVIPKGFKVTDYDKGSPWYEAEQVDRQKLDALVESNAERKAVEREYAPERATDYDSTDISGQRRRIATYNRLRGSEGVQGEGGRTQADLPRRFRARPSGYAQVDLDGQALNAYKRDLEPSVAQDLASVDSYSRTVLELESTPETAKYFSDKIKAAKESSRFGASVYVYPESDYQGMTMYVTDDGTAGLALKDGNEIVSLFNEGTNPNVTYALGSLAVQEGAKYLDAFDTVLPSIYQDLGFEAVARVKWNDEFAPDDWDKKTFAMYKNGEPDVVFMRHSPEYFGQYSRVDGVVTDSYDDAVKIQRGGEERIRPEQNRINQTMKDAVQSRIDRDITAEELNQVFEDQGRFVAPMTADMVPELPSEEKFINALKKTNREKPNTPTKETYWKADVLEHGVRYGSRLDIPSYNSKTLTKDERADIVTVHASRPNAKAGSAGKRLGYYPTIRLKNGLFAVPEKGAVKIALGADKNTIATMEGDYVGQKEDGTALTHEDNRADFKKFINDPEWTQVSMNPERHSFYYDLEKQQPVESFSEAIQVGNLVIVKDAEYADVEDFAFIKKKQMNKELNKLDDGTPSTNKFSYNDEIDSQADLARRLRDKKIYASLVDRYAVLQDFEEQAAEYLEMGRLPAAISPRDQENLSHGRVQNDIDDFHERHIDPIGDLIAELGYTVEAVDIYLIAKHAAERNDAIAEKVKDQRARNIQRVENQIKKLKEEIDVDHSVQIANLEAKLKEYDELPLAFQDTGSGMTYIEAAKVLRTAEQEGTQADLERIASKVYDMLDEYRERMVTSGLLDEDTRADWEERFRFYVPLKGFAAQDDGETYVRDARSRGFSVVGKESMKARGRKTLPFSPLLTSFEDVQKKLIRARKNEYANTLLDLLSELGNSDSYTIYNTKFRPMKESDELTPQDLREMSLDIRPNGDPRYVEVKRDGQTFFIEFASDKLNHALQNMSVPMLSRANESMGKVLTLATRFQTFRRNMLINYNPTWGLVNPMRDVATGMMYAIGEMDKKGSRVLGQNLVSKTAQGYFPAMRSLWRHYRGKPMRDGNEYDTYVKEYVEVGAPTGMMLVRDADEQLRILKNKLKRGYTRDALKAIGKVVEDFNVTMENSIRFALYVEARKIGVPKDTAATLTKDSTVNFNRKGEDSAVVGAGYLFFNAAVQGNMNFLQTLQDDGSKGDKRTTGARKTALGLVALGSAITLFNILTSEEDDDEELKYADLPEHAKNRALLFMYSPDEGFALQAPYGYNFFTNIGRLSTEVAMGTKDFKEAGLNLWENFLLNFVPVAPSSGDSWEDAARGFYPDLLELHLDLMANKNFFGSDIYIEQNPLFIERSAAYNERRSTDKMFSVPAQFLNDLTGGDKYEDGYIALNPDKMQYIYEYFLGGVGRFVSQTTDVVSRGLADEEFRNQDLPIVGSFFESPSDYEDRFEFYANWEETRKIVQRFKEAKDMKEVKLLQTEYQSFLPLLEPKYNGKGFWQIANKDLKSIGKSRKLIEKQDYSGQLNGEQKKRDMLDELEANENMIFDIFNKAYRKAEKGR
jgi:hypothetical protein